MALNWLDVAGNLAVGAIDKNEQYRQEELKTAMEELKQNLLDLENYLAKGAGVSLPKKETKPLPKPKK